MPYPPPGTLLKLKNHCRGERGGQANSNKKNWLNGFTPNTNFFACALFDYTSTSSSRDFPRSGAAHGTVPFGHGRSVRRQATIEAETRKSEVTIALDLG